MSYADDCTRVYSRTGAKAHLLTPLASPNAGYPAALCGLSPQWFESWYGTGTQAEHEKAESLPLCKRCEQKAAAQ